MYEPKIYSGGNHNEKENDQLHDSSVMQCGHALVSAACDAYLCCGDRFKRL